ncbi:MAG: hypothetical protein JOZ80_12180 [Acidobacteriaceae bacterium]|nr:hypothetical protein [Acidobacteriaceae bacterium]
MRQGSVLAPSGTFGSVFRLLVSKFRRTLIHIVSFSQGCAEQKRENEDQFAWLEAYEAALLEFNAHRASLAIDTAVKAIDRRKQLLGFSSKNAHEWQLLEHATRTLLTIRTHRVLPAADNTPGNVAHDASRTA